MVENAVNKGNLRIGDGATRIETSAVVSRSDAAHPTTIRSPLTAANATDALAVNHWLGGLDNKSEVLSRGLWNRAERIRKLSRVP
jgi:hypothetical protein